MHVYEGAHAVRALVCMIIDSFILTNIFWYHTLLGGRGGVLSVGYG